VRLEGVVNALRNIHGALVPGGLLFDMQPVGGRVPVEAAGERVGSLDMREWARTVAAVARLVDGSVADGMFSAVGERRYDVRETFDDGAELVETVSTWDGTKISHRLAAVVRHAAPPFVIVEPVRLRLLRAV
jgi:hypothetical protein